MDFIKELLAIQEGEQEQVAAGDLKVDDQVHDQLDKAADDDNIDSQCFGLEMEDGKVVKVYVKQEDAEAFEEAMSARLGEDDDIQAALDELGKDFEIIEVVWPDEGDDDEEDDEEETDGSESLNNAVDDIADEEEKKESLTYGQSFAKKTYRIKMVQ